AAWALPGLPDPPDRRGHRDLADGMAGMALRVLPDNRDHPVRPAPRVRKAPPGLPGLKDSPVRPEHRPPGMTRVPDKRRRSRSADPGPRFTAAARTNRDPGSAPCLRHGLAGERQQSNE